MVAAEHSGGCRGDGGNAGWLLYVLATALRHHHRHCRCWGLAHTCPTGAVLTGYKNFFAFSFTSCRVHSYVSWPPVLVDICFLFNTGQAIPDITFMNTRDQTSSCWHIDFFFVATSMESGTFFSDSERVSK